MLLRVILVTVLLAPTGPIPVPAAPVPVPAAPVVAAPADHCLGQCLDILPPGQNGNATLVEVLAHQTSGYLPAHSRDQLDRYAALPYARLTGLNLDAYLADASFGVRPGQVERSYQPRADVTVVRDRATGVPHVTGTTRAGTMFGAGYAGAEDRLFTMDLLRRVGRGTLTPFAGGSPGNRALEQSLWRTAPYTDEDLATQAAAIDPAVAADMRAYLDGVNAYVGACRAGSYCPGEYALTGNGGPQPFAMPDLVAISAVIGGLFGSGGGAEMQSALVRVAARARYGTAEGDRVWQGFRSQDDPETVLTLHDGQSFPYGQAPPNATPPVLPDAGSVTAQPVVAGETVQALPRHGMSNAAVISGRHTTDGHPVAVFGPQTGYFAPQLLMVQELQGPGISARGASFAGLNFYVLLGRGPDYAWSATSAGQDITDTYALPLCSPDGSAPTQASDHYVYRGECLAMERLTRVNAWRPSTADPTPAGSYTMTAQRTRLGLVAWRGTVGGQPYAFAELRSTYRHEADSGTGFRLFNDPAAMADATAFRAAAGRIDLAFNWFYVNDRQTAYLNSGRNPVRAATADPNLPQRADLEWRDYDPATNTAGYEPLARHPQSTDQDWYVSWNNKQARDFAAADGNFSFGPVQRADLLDRPIRAALAAGARFDRASLTALVAQAGLTDLRARVLDEALQLVGPHPALQAWLADGARRVETTPGSRGYTHADAIRLFDAWWPRLVEAQFRGPLGDDLFGALAATLPINESPSGLQRGPTPGTSTTHQGSAFQFGWWGYVDRDLRSVLAGTGGFCGGGTVAGCRQVLLDSLRAAAAEPASTTYPGDALCAAGDGWCADAIAQSPLGGIRHPLISWQNRPTYQQVVSFPAHRGDDVARLPATATASASQLFHPPGLAVDGDVSTRWASDWSDGQWLQVDLGASRPVGRAILSWEAAYPSAYRIETSANGTTWRPAATVAASDGGRDVVPFTPTTARYVRVTAVTRATGWGISLFEVEVYGR
jgi:acyl-homoserine lactone acylase PvdQ